MGSNTIYADDIQNEEQSVSNSFEKKKKKKVEHKDKNDQNANDIIVCDKDIANRVNECLIFDNNFNLEKIVENSNEYYNSQLISNSINDDNQCQNKLIKTFNINQLSFKHPLQEKEKVIQFPRKQIEEKGDFYNTIGTEKKPLYFSQSVQYDSDYYNQKDQKNILSDRTMKQNRNEDNIKNLKKEGNNNFMNNPNSNDIDGFLDNNPEIFSLLKKRKRKKKKKKTHFKIDNNNNQQINANQNISIEEIDTKSLNKIEEQSKLAQLSRNHNQFTLEQQTNFNINASKKSSKDKDILIYPSIDHIFLTSNETGIANEFTIQNHQLCLPLIQKNQNSTPSYQTEYGRALSISYFTLEYEGLITDSSKIQKAKDEISNLNNQITLLSNTNNSQRAELKDMNNKINMRLNTIKLNIPSNRSHIIKTSRNNNNIKLIKNSKSIEMQSIQLKNANQKLSLLTQEKLRYNNIIAFPNLKFIQSQSQNLSNQIKDLKQLIKKLKNEKDENSKCLEKLINFENDIRLALEDLKQSTIVNDQLLKKIQQAEKLYEQSIKYRKNANKIKRKSAPSLDKVKNKEEMLQFPVALDLFTNKENKILKEVYNNNRRDYNKLMKSISLIESLRDSKEIIHTSKIRNYISLILEIEKRIHYESTVNYEEMNKKRSLNIQANNVKNNIRENIGKLSKLSFSLTSIQKLIDEKSKEINMLNIEINELKKFEQQQLTNLPVNNNSNSNSNIQ